MQTRELRRLRETRDYERYEAYRLFEEKTDISERLSLPIETYLELEIEDGKVYGRTREGGLKRMTEWSEESLRDANADSSFGGANSVERRRRQIELDEAYQVEQLLPGQMLEVLSPIPDAVMSGQASLNGYRTDMARTLGRAYYHDGERMHAVTYSLEQSDKDALGAVLASRGMSPASLQSESIQETRRVSDATMEGFRQLASQNRSVYDQALFEMTGQQFYAGGRIANRKDAMSFISSQNDLLHEHMDALAAIMSMVRDPQEREQQAEQLRRRTSAAIDERLHGGVVASIGDGAVDARLSSGNYEGECSTGATPTSTQEQLGLSLGKLPEKTWMTCPFCSFKTYGDPCASTLVCNECGAMASNGKIVSKGIGRNGVLARKRSDAVTEVTSQHEKKANASLHETVKRQFGEYAVLKTEVVVAGAVRNVYDKRTNELIAQV